MRKWMKKWQGVIIWAIAIAFVAGMIWWSVSINLRSTPRNVNYTLDQSLAYITKNGTALNDPAYWLMPWEVNDYYSNLLNSYRITSLDPLFEEPRLKALIADVFLQQKVVLYYAEKSNVKPSKKEIEQEVNNVINTIKSDRNQLERIKRLYGSLTNYEKNYLEPQTRVQLTVKKVRETVGAVTEDEIKQYFEENKENLQNQYDRVDLDAISFDSSFTAREFLAKANELGFDEAASSMELTVQSFSNATRGIFPEEMDTALFSATPGSIVGPFYFLDQWYVFRVKTSSVLADFNAFENSDAYSEVKTKLEQEKFQKWLKEFMKEEKLSYAFNDQVLEYWWRYLKNEEGLYEKLSDLLFQEDKLVEEGSDELKSLFVLLSDTKIQEITKQIAEMTQYEEALKKSQEPDKDLVKKYGKLSLEEVAEKKKELENERKAVESQKRAVVAYLYANYPSSTYVLEYAYQMNPNDVNIRYNYYSNLYNQVKPYLSTGGYDPNQVIRVMLGLYTVANATNASTDMRLDSYYMLYDMSLALKDPTSAKSYLDEMKKIDPNFMDYESAYNQVESLLEELKTEESTSSTTTGE
ncbi:peptidyl-prolyl cis-trans isomerase [Thermotoga sp.]|uniref:peptidyl-prolyl cis-trans isomerase n=1 Tax=Thermotoga sp. TaxID=28240 RepID=UPI0025F129CE|nr:peptidyl-prolyl cis-trans isomerase [Thermotoga sp.]MCD6550998.1 peptidyl-prolyl cis-trans isomerase [Thermotoga sp.]